MATDSTPAASMVRAARSRSSIESGSISRPVASRRPRTVRQSSRGTSGSGRVTRMSYRLGRSWRPMSRRSRKPALVMNAVRAPWRWITALVAVVMPWPTYFTSAPLLRCRASAFARPAMVPSARSSGVVETLETVMARVASS